MENLPAILPALDAFVKQQMARCRTPGVSLALTDRERLLHVASYGYADLSGAPVRPETVFEIGSITKSFTAIAMLQLCEEGRLDLQAPVSCYLPWFHVPSRHQAITLHHLLSHTGGIIQGSEFSTEASYEVWALHETEAAAPPGTFFHYSNVGYKALGLVLEAVEGQPYPEIIRRRILDRLDMTHTDPAITHATRQRMATGYTPWFDDRPFHRDQPLAPATWLETGTADGSIAAPAADMAIYLRALLNRGAGLLSETSFRRLIEPVIAMLDEPHGDTYGYGLFMRQQAGHTIIFHDGGMVGYYAAMVGDMEAGLGVFVLTNGPGEPADYALPALELLVAATGDGPLPALPEPPDPTLVAEAADYAGEYGIGDKRFALAAEGQRLVMHHRGARINLEQRGRDCFYVPQPDFDLFLLHLGRHEGRVVEAWHGPDWYPRQGTAIREAPACPDTWRAYPGHYRSHNPWFPNFRVVLRRGALFLIDPDGDEEPLVPLSEGLFRSGEDECSPERIRFDTVLDGRAIRANLSGCDYYRTFTP